MGNENLYTPDCIRTYTGLYMNVFEPTSEMIDITDIAHALSYQCRFGGHLPKFYSVAQHCLNCSYLIGNPELKLAALLHDASEAYLLDIPRPIKNRLANYKEIENGLMKVIAEEFGFVWPLQKEIKVIDEAMLQTEWDCLMLGNDSHKLQTKDEWETQDTFVKMFSYYTRLANKETAV